MVLRPERVVELTRELVAIPSHLDGTVVQDHLRRLLSGCGFDCALAEPAPGRPTLLARRGTGGPFLCSHADVHPPHGHADPFTCRREEGLLVGRGVVDAKGQLAALLAACEAARDAPATVLVTSDEESDARGSEHLGHEIGAPDGGLVLEPTGGTICVAQSGCIDLAVEVRGPGGHAHASEGVSALDALEGAVDALRSCRFLGRRHPLLPPPALRLTRVHGGEHPWRRPAAARADLSAELTPGTPPAEAEAELAETLDALTAAWQLGGPELTYELLDLSEPHEVPEDLPAVARLRRSAPDAPIGGMPSWTDAANLAHHHGIRCAVFGAGDLDVAHSDREWVRIEDLTELAETLVRLLEDAPLRRP